MSVNISHIIWFPFLSPSASFPPLLTPSPSLAPSLILSLSFRFQSSNDESEMTNLEQYIERMKEKQEHIYFMAAPNRAEAEDSPFVERLLRKGYEVLVCLVNNAPLSPPPPSLPFLNLFLLPTQI